MSQFGLRVALRTVVDVFADVARLGLLTLQSRTQLAVENLFLRKQLALYEIHHVNRRVVTPAAIAGDTRSVRWILMKL